MALFGDDTCGFELAEKLEATSVWRAWLGDSEYGLLKPHLATAGAWLAFMQPSENSSLEVLKLQLRVRALLFEKAASILFSEPLDLQLHADSVYFSLEKDAEDWDRLKAEGSPALAALQMQHGVETMQDGLRHDDGRKKKPFIGLKSSDLGTAEPLFTRVKKEMAWEPMNNVGKPATSVDLDNSNDIWYDRWLNSKVMERMSKLAYRLAQQKCPFGERDAFVRTPKGMAKYLDSTLRVKRKRKDEARKLRALGRKPTELSNREVFGSTVKLELGFEGEDPDCTFPEFMFLGNCIPDNPVPGNNTCMSSAVNGSFSPLMDLESTPVASEKNTSFGLKKNKVTSSLGVKQTCVGEMVRRDGLSELQAQVLTQRTVVSIVAGSGYEGLREAALDILSDMLRCYVRRLGDNLRRLVDRYGKHTSEVELLQMYMQTSKAGTVAELMNYVRATSREQEKPQQQQFQYQQQIQQARRRQMQHQFPQLQMNQVQAQQLQRQLSNPTLSQLHQQHLGQQQLDRSKRRQVPTPRGKRLEKVESKLPGETTSCESPVNVDTKVYGHVQNMSTLQQQHPQQSLWQPQQSLQGMLLSQPHMMQHIKQQFSSLPQHPSYQP